MHTQGGLWPPQESFYLRAPQAGLLRGASPLLRAPQWDPIEPLDEVLQFHVHPELYVG